MKKKRKGRQVFFIIMILSLVIIAYILLNTKINIDLIKNEVKLVENKIIENKIVETEDLTDEYEYIKNNINLVFYDNERIVQTIKNFIETNDIESINSVDEDLVSEFKNNYNETKKIVEYSQKYLNEQYKLLLETNVDYYLDDEKIEFENLKNKYINQLSANNYKSAREFLEEVKVFTEETNKLANKRKLDEIYDENYSGDPYTREPKIENGIILVNKEFGLSPDYAPGENAEARVAFEEMKKAAIEDDVYIEAFSTYRSYYKQNDLYYNYVYNYGEESANTFSARPGFSEHQTGLGFDIGGIDRSLWAKEDFKYTVEANWLKENAYKYGFILRYPEGKEWKTGYMYESWHFRYLGVEDSINFNNNNLTLEEYLGY